MKSSMTHEIIHGWDTAALSSKMEVLGSGRILDANIKVTVDGEDEAGKVMGNPFLVWSPVSLISDNLKEVVPGDDLRLWQAANHYGADHMKSLSVFARAESATTGGKKRLEYAFILSALRMMWAYRSDIASRTEDSYTDFVRLAGLGGDDLIWGARMWKTLPLNPDRSIQSLSCDGVEIGAWLRKWHDNIFSHLRVVEAWPVQAPSDVAAPYQSSVDNGAELRPYFSDTPKAVRRGPDAWRNLTRDDLEKLVWMHPRKQLADMLGVSDMAIHKKCRRELLSQPPRGFWQKIKKARQMDVYLFLLSNGVIPPDWWTLDVSLGNTNPMESAEGVGTIVA